MPTFVTEFWNGKRPLKSAFWHFFVPIQIALILSDRFLIDHLNAGLLLILVLPTFALYCVSLVAVWRCAPNHTNPEAPYTLIARAISLLLGLLWGLPIMLFILLALTL